MKKITLTNSLKTSMNICSKMVDYRIEKLLPKNFKDSKLVKAMRYSAISDGKKIRPFLAIASANIFNINPNSILDVACAIEFIHVYSLIHDDLPAMDNDDFRRGKPSNHKHFNEATAILAGDSLLTYAFEILSKKETCSNSNIRCELITTIAKASGFYGMTGGQMIDLEKNNKKISLKEMIELHKLKTGCLFSASVESGAIIGKANKKQREALKNFAIDLGLAFQIKDDILDFISNKKSKNISTKTETNIVDIIGMDKANSMLDSFNKSAVNHLKIFDDKASLLRDLIIFLKDRII